MTEKTESSRARGAIRPAVAAVVLLCVASGPARAQETMQDVLAFLVTNRAVQTDDFDRDQAAAEAARDTISQALLVALATLPLASSSGGFTYGFNPALGTIERASDSFGPFFLERALTAGADRASFGATWRRARYARLHGNGLRDGTFVTIANQFTDEPAPFDEESLALDIETTTITLFGSYGVSDRLEVGAAVPLVRMDLHGRRVNTYRGRSQLQAEATARTSGVGDVALRAKYSLAGNGPTGIAVGADLRLPTGRAADLLGAGQPAVTLIGIASVDTGLTAAHLNVGVTRGGVSDEVRMGGGLAVAASSRVTLSGELLGRYIEGLQPIAAVGAPHPRVAGVETTRLLPHDAGVRSVLGVAGVKWNVTGTWLLTGSMLWSLTDTGLTAPLMPSVTLDYSF